MALDLLEMFNIKLKEVLLVDLVNDYLTVFGNYYDEIFGRYGFHSFDKTAPVYIKEDVLKYVRSSLVEDISRMTTNGPMHLEAISMDVFIYPGNEERDSLKLFYFYLNGTIGEYVSISNAVYNLMFPSKKGDGLGRFGTMFMMEMGRYVNFYNVWKDKIKGLPAPDSIRHPFSGAPPARLFEITWDKVVSDFNKYNEKAIKLLQG